MIQEIIQSLIPMAAGWALATLWQGNEQIKARKKLQAILTEGERRIFDGTGWEVRGETAQMPPERLRQKMVFEMMASEIIELAKHATPKASLKQWTLFYRTRTAAEQWMRVVEQLAQDEGRESLDEPLTEAFEVLRRASNGSQRRQS